ncbi:MFS transporter [Embleya sp. NPDC056575]|uniref:MFS transporter n=1 Tax=unclassified Embleya TaxID=2699296 RepID=UPI003698B8A0
MQKRYRGIWPYIAGAAAARTGDEMSGPALLLAGLAATGSAATASALLAAVTAAAALGGPVFGVLLDRSPRPGRLLTATLAGYAAALGTILATLGRTPIAITLLIALTAGLAGPALTGGWTSQLPRVVTRADLPRATAYDAMTFNLAALTGPALAGIITTLAGATTAMTTAIVLICLALPAARALPPARARVAARAQVLGKRLTPPPAGTSPAAGVQTPRNHEESPPTQAPPAHRGQESREPSEAPATNGLPTGASRNAPPERPEPPEHPKPPTVPGHTPRKHSEPPAAARSHAPPKHPPAPSIGADLVAGFRAIVGSPSLARATAASMLSCVGQGILLAASPILGERAFGSAAHGPTLLSLLAASALTTNAFLARRPHPLRPETVIRYSTLILTGALLLAATAHPIPLIAAMLLAGVAEGPQLTALFTIRHREAPEALRSRIFTTGASLKITTFALGAALTGPLLTHSLTTALATAALFQVLATLSLTGRMPTHPADGRTNAGPDEPLEPEPEPEPEQRAWPRQNRRSPER